MNKMYIYKIWFTAWVFLLTPFIVSGQFRTFSLNIIQHIFTPLSQLVIGVALVVFIFGIARFMMYGGDDKSRAQGKQLMVWGTVVLFAMVSVWGIVRVIRTTFFG